MSSVNDGNEGAENDTAQSDRGTQEEEIEVVEVDDDQNTAGPLGGIDKVKAGAQG